MGDEIYWTNGSKRPGADQSAVTLYNLGVDYDFIPATILKWFQDEIFHSIRHG
jgi:hypothetical protein